MKFYIATTLANAAVHSRVRILLERMGHEITVDWVALGAVPHDDPDARRERAQVDANGVLDADFVVAAMPGAHGAHFEMGITVGIALAYSKLGNEKEKLRGPKVFLWNREKYQARYPCVFHDHPYFEWVDGDAADLITRIQAWIQNKPRWDAFVAEAEPE